ncbi:MULTISPECIES: LCP family protein [unclassified Streptomyces]|uniref:LCP family protein n=1 Tax=unclassified Streptomyces TaxID=2593676 RepID=UPI00202572DB|nr:LCP family protein [Streptomyces sp. A 4/2]WSV55126.1 LCP family protein [Streptomyces sp. NBC_01014]
MKSSDRTTPAHDRRAHGASRAQNRGKRRKRSRVRLVLAIAVSVVVLATAGAGWLYLRLSGNINSFSSDGVAVNRPAASTKGENVLVIGSDARTGGNSALGGGDKNDVGRSDTAFLLHIYADHKHALAVSIPRDTLVTIPSCKLPNGSWTQPQSATMFNAAYSVGQTAKGNPACTQNTVEKLTGLRVDHTVVVDFEGFSRLTGVVGGVQVCLPQDIYQRDLNPNQTARGKLLFHRGEQNVSGQQALDYVRIRHGIGDGSDIGRIKRQQAFVSALLKKVKDDGFTPTKLLPLADAATHSLTVDPGLSSADKLLSFVMSMKGIDLHNVKFITVPWRYQGSRVAIVEPDADALWSTLREDRTLDGKDASGKNGDKAPSPSPSAEGPVSGTGIAVAVQNGTTVTGLAGRAAQTLKDHSFTVTGTGTAGSQDHTSTVIDYGPGQEAKARTVARLFAGAELQESTAPGITVTVGTSYAADPTATASSAPSSVPSSVASGARSGDDGPCSDLSYG